MTPKERKEQNIRKANENWAKRKERHNGNPDVWRALTDSSFKSHIAMKKHRDLDK
jgi:hypothetical protein